MDFDGRGTRPRLADPSATAGRAARGRSGSTARRATGGESRKSFVHFLASTLLAELLDLNQATTSRHLKVLRDRSLVETDRQGVHIYYSLADERVIEALDLLREVLASTLEQRTALVEIMT